MEISSGELTLHDLIAWEPRIHKVAPAPESTQRLPLTTYEVDWVLTARSTQPMLPQLRGGELVILPDRIVREIGLPFGQLVGEIAMQPIAGILTDHRTTFDPDSPVVVLQTPRVDAETERDLNRLLTTGRRQALQRVADLDQAIVTAGARQSRPSELMDRLSSVLGLPVTIHTAGQTVLFTTGSGRDHPDADSPEWVHMSLRNGYTIWVGPVPDDQHAIARFAIQHLRDALQRALDSAASAAPRGSARAAALNSLLLQPASTNADQIAQRALEAGIPADRPLRVIRTAADVPDTLVHRTLQSFGDVHDAGEVDSERLWLLVGATGSTARLAASLPQGWLASSAIVSDARQLPEASRQSRYIARLLRGGLLTPGIVAFDDTRTLGVYGLLYGDWESGTQREYRDRVLGELLANDPRGLLVETLGAMLDHHGSQSLAAEALGIHRNTLSYRMRQIDGLIPVDMDDPHTRLTLHIAVTIHRLLNL